MTTATPQTIAPVTPVPGISPEVRKAITKFQTLRTSLCSEFHERSTESLIMCLAYIAGEHVALLGPHGSAKTELTTTFASALGVQGDDVFTYLMGKFTMPDELFGPVDIQAMKSGIRRRVTDGQLPDATVAVLDEVFKANSSILNSLLTLLNEREFDNLPDPNAVQGSRQVSRRRVSCPLEFCVGISNELPEGGPQGPLGPLYDRFMFRRWVRYIQTDDLLESLLVAPSRKIQIPVQITRDEVDAIRSARSQVRLDGPTQMKDENGNTMTVVQVVVRVLKKTLEANHGLVVSDRRWRKSMKAVQAHAILHGRMVATLEDLSPLAHVLWDEPEDADVVQSEVDKLANPDDGEAREIHAACVSLFQGLDREIASNGDFANEAAKVRAKLKLMMRQMDGLTPSPVVLDCHQKCQGYVDQIKREVNRRMGMDD